MLSKKGFYLGLISLCALAFLAQTSLTARRPLSGPVKESEQTDLAGSRSAPKVSADGTTLSDSLDSILSEAERARAASQNSRLKTELEWSFGGKAQHGWQIYVPLISQLIQTKSEADSPEFALALARWQRKAGRKPDGILDNETLALMIETWQSRRIKERAYPAAENLVTVSTDEFFDTSRPEELRRVERQTYAAYKRLIRAAVSDPASGLVQTKNGELASSEKYLKIVSAFRSREYQDRLREQSPNAGRAGLAVNSPHFTGRALDLYVGGEPVSTRDENRLVQTRTPVYRWLVRNAEKFGFVPYFYEPWHWEYRPA
jgi:LAS superfamily LD-carboxypeptidase LdcB